jgi:ribosomal protein L11 methyltransferase
MLELEPCGFEEAETENQLELVAYTDLAGEHRLRAEFHTVTSSDVEPGWEDRWRSFHRPVLAGGLWIGPPWEVPPRGLPAIVIDPGRAFGTGAHPTTRSCIELLSDVDRGSVLDAGCGSGVVSIAAVRLGFTPVVAVDADLVAIGVTRENAFRNGVTVTALEADVSRDELPWSDVLVANIELDAVEALLTRRPAVRAITSGYRAGQRPVAAGWRHERRLELDGWAADRFRA